MRINTHKSSIDAKTQDFSDKLLRSVLDPYIVLIGGAGE